MFIWPSRPFLLSHLSLRGRSCRAIDFEKVKVVIDRFARIFESGYGRRKHGQLPVNPLLLIL